MLRGRKFSSYLYCLVRDITEQRVNPISPGHTFSDWRPHIHSHNTFFGSLYITLCNHFHSAKDNVLWEYKKLRIEECFCIGSRGSSTFAFSHLKSFIIILSGQFKCYRLREICFSTSHHYISHWLEWFLLLWPKSMLCVPKL